MEPTYTSRQDTIEQFFTENPEAEAQRPRPHNDYNATIRSAFSKHIDSLHRQGLISDNLADDITLDDDEQLTPNEWEQPDLSKAEQFVLRHALQNIDADAPAEHLDVLELQAFFDWMQQNYRPTDDPGHREMTAEYVHRLVQRGYLSIHVMGYNGREVIYLERGEKTA